MATLLSESLEFLSHQILNYEKDPIDSLRLINERSLQLRMYARGEDLDNLSSSEVKDSSQSEPDEPKTNSDPIFEMPNETRFHLPPIPKIPGVDEDSFKNLLMSWFYAGYYTARAELVTQTRV
jgi:hypothetical protein